MTAVMPQKIAAKDSPFWSNLIGGVDTTVATEAADAIDVTVQLKDVQGQNLAQRAAIKWYLSTDAEGDNLASAPSGGTAAGAAGVLIEDIAEVSGWLVTNDSGVGNIVVTSNGTTTHYIVFVLPDGSLVVSDPLPFAA